MAEYIASKDKYSGYMRAFCLDGLIFYTEQRAMEYLTNGSPGFTLKESREYLDALRREAWSEAKNE